MLKDKDSKQSIQVTIRVRPLSEKQLFEDSRVCVRLQQSNSLHLSIASSEVKKFTFDSICFNESQQQIFNRVGRKCTLDCLEGYNCTIFAYGQTGAGKTYTMMGVNFQSESYHERRGLIPRTMQFLFECIDRERENGVHFVIRCSFLEIYNEQIIDLLNKANNNLQLREDTRKGVYVEGITEEVITRGEEAMEILAKGSKSRHVGSTFYNEASSRSHSVFTMQIESKYTKNGVSNTKIRQFNFIDLAGSERTKQSTGERLKEGCNINKSLMNLATVINALSEVSEGKMQHVNYRNSKLTFLLKDSLGGNSKTNLIANISPATVFFQETLSTLGFARRAKLIKREKACINQDSSGNLQSMKSEIKRLKQEVISLMSRVQGGSSIDGVQEEKPSEMTAIMHQYVEEEIDKQTRLELEILKLNDRIAHLQGGIRQYSSNEIHLRMIISVYQDKINRLKHIQKTATHSLTNLTGNNEQEAKAIISYFQTERNNFIRELESVKTQSDSNKFLKELLKEAKIMREDGEDDSLKELLVKNTNFLNSIRTKLDEMKPEKIEFEINSEFEKKITLMQQEFTQKEEEYQERLDQINLDLADYKNRNEENEKMLEEAINGQIVLEEKVRDEQGINLKLTKDAETLKGKLKQVQADAVVLKVKSEETIQELKSEIAQRQAQTIIAKKEVDSLKAKLEKSILHENALKAEFENLEEEKYKLDRQLLQAIEELRESKNTLLKSESETVVLGRKIEVLLSESNDAKLEVSKLQEDAVIRQSNLKKALEEIQRQHIVDLETKVAEIKTLKDQIQQHNTEVKEIHEKHTSELSSWSMKVTQLGEKQTEQQLLISNYQEKQREMLSIMNEKELNENQTSVQLSQAKIDLINAHSEMETLQAKYKKAIEELKEKWMKEQANYEQSQAQLIETNKLYGSTSMELQQKKKECAGLTNCLNKLTNKMATLEQQFCSKQINIESLTSQLDSLKAIEKEQKKIITEMKDEMFVAKKNSQIEIDALKGQVNVKDQQIEQLEKELGKTKQRLERQMEELKNEVETLTDSLKEQEIALNKTMESHIAAKEKKIADLKQALHERQQSLDQLESTLSQLKTVNEDLSKVKAHLEGELSNLEGKTKALSESNEQLRQQLEDCNNKFAKEMEEMEVIHNQQLDQKNEQIQAFMLENQALSGRIEESRVQLQNSINANASLLEEISIKDQNYKSLSQQSASLQSQMQRMRREFDESKAESQRELSENKTQSETHLNQALSQLTQLKTKLQEVVVLSSQEQTSKEELSVSIKSHQQEIERLNNDSTNYVNTISLLTQENYGLNQQLADYFHTRKDMEEQITLLQADLLQSEGKLSEKQGQIVKLEQLNGDLIGQLQSLQNIDLDNKQKLVELNRLTSDLTTSLEGERAAASHLIITKSFLQDAIQQLKSKLTQSESDLTACESELKLSKDNEAALLVQISQGKDQLEQLTQNYQEMTAKSNKANEELRSMTALQEETREKQAKETGALKTQNTFLIEQNRKQASQIITLSKSVGEARLEGSLLREKAGKLEGQLTRVSGELEELHCARQRWQLQASEMDRLRSQLEQERCSKERIYGELVRERESSSSLKLLMENKAAQCMQLEVELEEKDCIYKKLVEKIAKNENESKKTSNSEHYLKTIELLEKSRAEQIELRRQNQEWKKMMASAKETIEQKELLAKEVQQKSESYCVSMHKRMEEIQGDYVELQRNHEKLIKERKHYSHDNDQLREEVKRLKVSVGRLEQENRDMDAKIKKASLDYLQLEKEFDEGKRNEPLLPTDDKDRTGYINKLKAEIAALKTERVLLNQTVVKEREEKTKLKAEMRYGKEGAAELTLKLDLEKKVNQNKNLTELIFQIISQLKICVNEPKTKLEVIRSTILGAIKEKNAEIKTLRDKAKECENDHHKPNKPEYPIVHNRELKALSVANNNRPVEESLRFEKEKDPSFLNNNSRQKIKEFQKYYAKFKTGDEPRPK